MTYSSYPGSQVCHVNESNAATFCGRRPGVTSPEIPAGAKLICLTCLRSYGRRAPEPDAAAGLRQRLALKYRLLVESQHEVRAVRAEHAEHVREVRRVVKGLAGLTGDLRDRIGVLERQRAAVGTEVVV